MRKAFLILGCMLGAALLFFGGVLLGDSSTGHNPIKVSFIILFGITIIAMCITYAVCRDDDEKDSLKERYDLQKEAYNNALSSLEEARKKNEIYLSEKIELQNAYEELTRANVEMQSMLLKFAIGWNEKGQDAAFNMADEVKAYLIKEFAYE